MLAREEISSALPGRGVLVPLGITANSRLGLQRKNTALHWGPPWSNLELRLGREGVKQRYTGKERDGEIGNDNFGARYFGSGMGRFLSPDPSSISLANLSDPQQLNLYSYVRNNPLTLTDPTGLDPSCTQAFNNQGTESNNGDCTSDTNPYASGVWGGSMSAWFDTIFGAQNATFGNAAWATQQSMAFFGSNYWNLPGNSNPGLESELAYAATVGQSQRIFAAQGFTDGILGGENSCSEFFDSAASTFYGSSTAARSIFDTDNITLGANVGASEAAHTTQGTGRNSTIFLNPSGAFFNSFGIIGNSPQPLMAGPYGGGTLQADITILLHEFGHTIDAVPADFGNAAQSMANTNTVVSHCGKQIGR